MKENQLQVILKEQNIEKESATAIVKAFGGPFEEAGEILATYKSIEVTDESQTDLMLQARSKRLALKKARTTVETNRKALKEDIVKQARAIDSIARFVKESIQPAEEYLEQQEKFAEIKRAERAAQLKAERVEKLMQYTDDISVYNLSVMSNDQFNTLLNTLKAQHEAKLAEEKRIEAERIAKEKSEAEERERVRKENERLKKEAEEREAVAAKERAEAEKREAKLRAEREAEQRAAQARLDEERKKREAIEAEQRKAREEAEIEQRRKEEEERWALLAPDKNKLTNFSLALEQIRLQKLPSVKTKQAQDIVNNIDKMLVQMQEYITSKAKNL
jgi:hypothetical protein